jgi:hypothetical protein
MNERPDDRSAAAATRTSRADAGEAPTAAQLRDDIDSGRTGDKVAHSDPAAAPLGTDDEAAGSPPTAGQVSQARRHEAGRDVRDPSPADQPPMQAGMAPSARLLWLIVAVVVICTGLGVALSL